MQCKYSAFNAKRSSAKQWMGVFCPDVATVHSVDARLVRGAQVALPTLLANGARAIIRPCSIVAIGILIAINSCVPRAGSNPVALLNHVVIYRAFS